MLHMVHTINRASVQHYFNVTLEKLQKSKILIVESRGRLERSTGESNTIGNKVIAVLMKCVINVVWSTFCLHVLDLCDGAEIYKHEK